MSAHTGYQNRFARSVVDKIVSNTIIPALPDNNTMTMFVNFTNMMDMIIDNLEKFDDGNFVINEVNTSPHLLVHYEVQNQEKLRAVQNAPKAELDAVPSPNGQTPSGETKKEETVQSVESVS